MSGIGHATGPSGKTINKLAIRVCKAVLERPGQYLTKIRVAAPPPIPNDFIHLLKVRLGESGILRVHVEVEPGDAPELLETTFRDEWCD
jgi:hypothetical protein